MQTKLEFHNVSSSNEEVIKRLSLVVNSNLGKKIVITYSAENEKNKAINLIKKLSLKVLEKIFLL